MSVTSPWTELLSPGVHTVARMQSRQVVGMGRRKTRELVVPRLPVDFDRRYERRVPDDTSVQVDAIAGNNEALRASGDDARDRYRTRAREAAAGAPTFLNRSLDVADGPDVAWYDERFDELPLLWPLKLYAFQPLEWTVLGFGPGEESRELASTFDGWIRSWMESVEMGRPGYLRREWTPWAVSLRVRHWCRYLAWRRRSGSMGNRDGFELAFRRELYRNVLFLRNHVERDVGGNHLVENGAALVVAGVLFSEDAWIDEGTAILADAAGQFLEDGFHFERSPMYHVLTLTRYLTVRDLLERSDRPVPEAVLTTADRATAFLRFLRPPDGRIPLLNDAVYGQALPLEDCLRYADAVGVGAVPGADAWSAPGGGDSPARTSGYRWLRTDDGALLVDGGCVGPRHLPGHSHSDTLSVLAWLGDRRVFTDTGTFGYVRGPERAYARGVRGHGTVQVGDAEPISLGGKYLMGPRPEPSTRSRDGPVSLFEGCYEATPDRATAYGHHRAAYGGDDWWLVDDTVWGHDGEATLGRLHVHPDVDAVRGSNGRVRLELGDGDGTAYVYPLEATGVGIAPGQYFPRFGVATVRQVLEVRADDLGTDPATFGFLLTRRDLDAATVETAPDDRRPTALRMDDDEYRLPATRLPDADAGSFDPSSF